METNSNHELNEATKVLSIFVNAMLITAALAAIIWLLIVAIQMSPLSLWLLQLAKTPWHLSRATGTVAYLLLTGSVGWGLVLSTKIIKELTPAPFALAIHDFISWLAIGFAGFHALILLLDNYIQFSVFNLLVPFTGSYRPGWVGLGIVAMYIMVLTAASFSWRQWLGQHNWRLLHYLTFPAYGLVTLHGLMAGTDSANPGMRAVYLGSVTAILFLTNYRILAAHRERRNSAKPVRKAVEH